MKTSAFSIRFAVLLFALAWPLQVQAQELTETSDGFRAVTTKTFDVAPGGDLVIDGVVGGITVTAWDRNQVEVVETIRLEDYTRAEAEAYLQRYATTFQQSEATVRVEGPNESGGWRSQRGVQRSYEARVPVPFAVRAQTAGGGIEVDGVEGRVDVRTAGGGINIKNITGDVDAVTAGGGINLTNINGQLRAQTSGGGINVDGVTGGLEVRTAGGGINIRDVGADVDARTSGGGMNVEQVRGAVQARTAGGDVNVTDATGDVVAETSGGDVTLIDIGGRIEARTAGGDIEGRNLGSAVRARTAAGDIELDGVQGGVQAETSVGDIEVAITLQAFSGDYSTRLTTSHGDIELALPPGIPASIRAEVRTLGPGWDRDDIYSDFPLSRESPREGGSGTLRSYGDINGGGPPIELRTSGGSIRIERGQ